ncbi:hypothetical protein HY501_00165 [Candidatus Woesearchaeota archaeon]|nr:hypothetical protein [Candidatus Woesearchaeota archaeon]
MKALIPALLLALHFASALNIEGEFYSPGETLVIAAEKGALAENISFFLNETETRLGFITVEGPENTYFFTHLPLDLVEGTYAVRYNQEEAVVQIMQANLILLIKNPVHILEKESGQFNLELENKGQDLLTVNVSTTLQPARASLEMSPGTGKTLFVDYNGTENMQLSLHYGGKVRNIILAKKQTIAAPPEKQENDTAGLEEPPKANFLFIDTPKKISHVVAKARVIEGALEFMADASVQNVSFIISPELAAIVELNQTIYSFVEKNNIYQQYLWINRQKTANAGKYEGQVTVVAENANPLTLELSIEFAEQAESREESVPLEEGKNVEIIEEPVITAINLSGEQQEEEGKNRRAGLLALLAVLILVGLIIYKLRPKKEQAKPFEEIIKKP